VSSRSVPSLLKDGFWYSASRSMAPPTIKIHTVLSVSSDDYTRGERFQYTPGNQTHSD
jgi:hypothetical protein